MIKICGVHHGPVSHLVGACLAPAPFTHQGPWGREHWQRWGFRQQHQHDSKEEEAGPDVAPDATHLRLPPQEGKTAGAALKVCLAQVQHMPGNGASEVVECLLLGGRMMAKDAI